MKTILIIGSGGREHALTWHLAQSPSVKQIIVAPGNPGTAQEPKTRNINIQADDIEGLCTYAQTHAIDLCIVGPEVPLALGISDAFAAHSIPCFGPTQKAAKLESSKAFAKQILNQYDIPTPKHQVFHDKARAQTYLQTQTFPLVIKQDGLASGKGVVIAHTEKEAIAAIDRFLDPTSKSSCLLIEDFIVGYELSFIVMVGPNGIIPLITAQDYKHRDAGNRGPNTGGMGSCAPSPHLTHAEHAWIMQHIIHPTVAAMQKEQRPYHGFLYAGLMVSEKGITVLEFNCRLGDPETQVILPLLKSDLADVCLALLDQNSKQALPTLAWRKASTVGVVLANQGYPAANIASGEIITGLRTQQQKTNIQIFHAGTTCRPNGDVIASGGRVLCVVGRGKDLRTARTLAYDETEKLHWPSSFCRPDIGSDANPRSY